MSTTTATSLRPYGGTFGPAEARHLLRRATIAGCTQANVDEAVELGLAGTVARLLVPHNVRRPVTTIEDHPVLSLGDDWTGTRSQEGFAENWRKASVRDWVIAGLVESGFSASGRMWFFWLNHFGATTDAGIRAYRYHRVTYDEVFGDFRQMVRDMTIDPLMLDFLNGDQNKAEAPNENYARELLELFTIGKQPLYGSGGAAPYTEGDVRELARALTGWRVRDRNNRKNAPRAEFQEDRHDPSEKRLSAAFGNAVISDAGADEYRVVVDTILAQPRSLDYVCRKFYRWLVDYRVDEAAEAEVIRPLADVMRATGFDIGATLRTLLQSEHFFDPSHRGALAKSPLEHIAEAYLGFGGRLPRRGDTKRRTRALRYFHWKMYDQGLSLHEPDSVAGFGPFHQEPSFNRYWVNPTNLLIRGHVTERAVSYGIDLQEGDRLIVDLLGYIDTFANPSDPNDLIAELAERHLPVPMPYDQVTTLKDYLIPDLPDWEWTVEYELYRANPGDEGQREAVAKRVRAVWFALAGSAEFTLY